MSKIQELYSLKRFGSQLRLDPTFELLTKLNNPEKKLKVIHVAGTNGKGSTCAMLASILQQTGLKVGLYTSPHLIKFNERIKINNTPISDHELEQRAEKLLQLRTDQTFFEVTTVMALDYFAENNTDIVVLETGLGGRFDATNVIPAENTLLSIITHIALEHTEHLGDTIEKIAFEKAGIIKQGVPVLTSNTDETVLTVLHNVCQEKKARLLKIDQEDIDYAQTNLKGKYQKQNAAVANCAMQLIESLSTTVEQQHKGLMNVHWPGRMQFAQLDNKEFLFDCAHNLQGVKTLCKELAKLRLGYDELILVFAAMDNKDIKQMTTTLFPHFTRIILTKPEFFRSEEPEKIYTTYNNANKILPEEETKVILMSQNVKEALDKARAITRPNSLIVVAGSIYLVGEAFKELNIATH